MHPVTTFLRHWAAAATLALAVSLLFPGTARAQEAFPPGAEAVPAERSIVISLADRRLYLLEEGQPARSFPVAIGRPGVAIPLGETAVMRKRRNPTWHPTASQRRAKPSLPLAVPPGPSNPLGKFALDLGWTAIAIHGTNEPGSIGHRASSGCFRMMPADIETVFAAAEVGTPVRVVNAAVDGPVPAGKAPARAPAPVPVVRTRPHTLPAVPPPPSPPVEEPVPARAPRPAVTVATLPAPVPEHVVPDPRCATASAPLRRMICTVPDLTALDERARGLRERFLDGLADEDRDAASYTLLQEEQRFDDRMTALCWVRKGTEDDPAVAAAARACLSAALTGRLEELERRTAEHEGAAVRR